MQNNNQIQKFHNKEFGSIDILMIDGKPYFPATECAIVLGYSKPHNAISRHCCDSLKRGVIDKLGREQKKTYIPEGDLYRLIIRSKLPAAERFEAWLVNEVLPTIRKYGAYATNDTLDEIRCSPEFAERLICRLEEEQQRSADLQELTTELVPKAMYFDQILQCKNTVPVSLIAKDYGMSAIAFNAMLYDFGIQYPIGGTWLLYQRYANKGYAHTYTYVASYRKSAMHTCWTQKGRLFLYKFLSGFGIYPTIETGFGGTFPA